MRFGRDDYLIKISHGYMESDRIIITDGLVKDFEKKIERHKREAIIEIEFLEGLWKLVLV